jgi:SAM-dependent methyltransferase
MRRSGVFEAHSERYDEWFVRHEPVYHSELLALRALLPWRGLGLEIGVGTGRFAAPLGVRVGLDPARAMLFHARQRGVNVVQGIAEGLPFADAVFGYVLMVVVLSFISDVRAALAEIRRVLKAQGVLAIGFLDYGCPIGRAYLERHARRVFFRDARFYASAEVEALLASAGFHRLSWVQTLYGPPEKTTKIEALRPGRGDGAFVVVSAVKG